MTFKRLQEQAYDHLKNMVLSGKFEAGIIYSETKIAETLGISRTPTRDALQRLSHDGFIDIMPSKGFRLHQLAQNDVAEIYQMRCAVEGYCARLLAQRRDTPEAIEVMDNLAELLDKLEEVVIQNGEVKAFVALDYDFHSRIVSFARNEVFNEIYTNQIYRISIVATDALAKAMRMRQSLEEHRALYDAIMSGDGHTAYTAILTHYDNLSQRIPQTYSPGKSPSMPAMGR